MKKTLLFKALSAIYAVSVLYSCGDVTSGEPYLGLSSETVTVYADTRTFALEIECNGDWEAYSDDLWITVVNGSGKGDGGTATIELSFALNDTDEDRSGVVSISGESDFKTVLVKQRAVFTRNISDFFRSVYSDDFSKVYICAHRAYTYSGKKDKDCPENSIPAVLRCIEKGIDMVEIDVRETSDGQLVCCHDADIGNVTVGKGKVSDMTYAEISSYDMTMSDGTKVPGVKVPLLGELLAVCKDRIWVNLDLAKTTIAPSRIIGEIRKAGMLDQVTCYTGSDIELAKSYCRLSNGRLSPHVSVSSSGNCGAFAGLESCPMFQINTAKYYDGQSGHTELPFAIKKEGYCVFSNLLDYDYEVQNGKMDALECFVDARIDFLQTDNGDSPYITSFLEKRGLM